MDVALVQHAEHDVDRDQRGQDQDGLVGERVWNACAVPMKLPWTVAGMPISLSAASICVDRVAQRDAGRKIERERDGRKLSLVVDRERACSSARNWANALSGTSAPGGAHVDATCSVSGILLILRVHFHHDVILIQRRVHGGHLALAEGIVERIVDQLRRDAEARGGVAVDRPGACRPLILLVAVDVANVGKGSQLLEQARRPALKSARLSPRSVY